MRMSYSEKIEKINNDRKVLLSMIKDATTKDNNAVIKNLDDVVSILNFDEQNVKEYVSIIKAKELIAELTEQIANTKNIEDIVKLRKRINYYINKIKKEIKKRNIDEESFDNMYNSVVYLRKDIAMYIRFLKREFKLNEIVDLYQNIDNLSQEEIDKLKKLLKNELNYNRRNIKAMNDSQEKVNLVITDKLEDNTNNLTDEVPKTNVGFEQLQSKVFIEPNPVEETLSNNKIILQENSMVSYEVYLTNKIQYYKKHYAFEKLNKYNGSFLKKCISLLRNIPVYNWNKKVMKKTKSDYYHYYSGEDFAGYIAYHKKNNSIKTALLTIFGSSHLSQREIECLYDHDKCVKWIMEFYSNEKNDYASIKSLKRKTAY